MVSKDNQELANSFLEDLDDNDDVQNCFSNIDFDSELLEVNNA